MTLLQEKKWIPSKLMPLLDVPEKIKKGELNDLMWATRRFVEWILEGDYSYDISNDPDLENLEALVSVYIQHIKGSKAPENTGLLNTKTYHRGDPRNPNFIEKIKVFWIGKPERTQDEKSRYLEWLRSMILIDRKSAESNPEKIEEKANQYVARAIRHIDTTFFSERMEEELPRGDSQSPFYSVIHKETNTVYDLLYLAQKYLREYCQFAKISPQQEKDLRAKKEKDLRAKNDRNKALYEIARIFAFVSMYIHIEHVPWQENRLGDKLFLVSKILELTENEEVSNIQKIFDSDNPFFDYTETKKMRWKRKEGGGYEYIQAPISLERGTFPVSFESLMIKWVADTRGRTKTVPIIHIDFRNEKSPESAANKWLRKGLNSPEEILDGRWCRFVVETEQEANTLLNILAYNLSSTPETAWSEKPKWEKNRSSGENYKCLKWTLNVLHKRTNTKEALTHIREAITDPITIERLDYLFSDKWHILETEIQIFVGVDSYISAHHDKVSPAYVHHYKHCQHLEELSLMLPPAIFPEAHAIIVARLAEKETQDTIKKIRNKLEAESQLI